MEGDPDRTRNAIILQPGSYTRSLNLSQCSLAAGGLGVPQEYSPHHLDLDLITHGKTRCSFSMHPWNLCISFPHPQVQRADAKNVVEGYNGTGIPMLMNNQGMCEGIVWPEALAGGA